MLQPWERGAKALTRAQHGVVSRAQLLGLGATPDAIRQRLERGRLHEIHRGVYAVGRKELGRHGELMAAVLACGPEAQLSHGSGAELWRIGNRADGPIHVAAPGGTYRARPGITLHRCRSLSRRHVHRIPVGDPVSILIDLAICLPDEEVEDAVNAADRLGLVRTPRLRHLLDACPSRPGVGRLKRILDAQTFSRSQTILERRFLSLVRDADLPLPTSQKRIGRCRVDFLYADHRLVVECDSLRYHRTAASQTRDLERDQAHTRAGLRTLRFTHFQVFKRPAYVKAVLAETLGALGPEPARPARGPR
jgi:very-short-patch-repair endonuclease